MDLHSNYLLFRVDVFLGVNLLSRNGNSQTGERMTQKRPRDGWILDPHGPERLALITA